jgi:hypothetical protein
MTSGSRKPNDALTIADLCEAIAEHEIPYTLRDGQYQLTGRDLRRLRRTQDDADADVPLGLLADADVSDALNLR